MEIFSHSFSDTVELFSHLYSISNVADEEYYPIWKEDLSALLKYKVVRSPELLFQIHWNILDDNWFYDVPIICKSEQGIKKTLLYFWLTEMSLGDFTMTDVIYRKMPSKFIFSVTHTEEASKPEIELRRKGNLKKISIEIPKCSIKDEVREKCKNFLDNYNGNIISNIINKSRNIPGEDISYIIVSNKVLKENRLSNYLNIEISECPILCGLKTINKDEIFNNEIIETIKDDLVQIFKVIADFDEKEEWIELINPNRFIIEKLVKAFALHGLTGATSVNHYPSRDVLEGDRELATGGVIIYGNENTKIDEDWLLTLLNLRNRASSIHQHKEKVLQFAKRSARAAIMARNMSHNIGSHVLSSISSSVIKDKPEDVSMLNSYLQQRMDFIARVTTEWPEWSEPVFFFSDLLQGFFNQGFLLNSITRDDGYFADEICFRIKYENGEKKEVVWKYCEAGPEDQKDGKNYSKFFTNNDFRDFVVEIPGGPIGKQAFYGFLENAIRNAAKHNSKSGDGLEIILKVEKNDNNDSFYVIRYFDNVSKNENDEEGDKTLVPKIQDTIKTDLIDKSGTLVEGNWGIQEMKVYADFLAYPFILGPNEFAVKEDEAKKYRLWAEPYFYESKNENVVNQEVLSYKFGLQKGRLILFVDDNDSLTDEQKKTAKQVGTLFSKFKEDGKLLSKIQELSPQCLVFVTEKERDGPKKKKIFQFIEDNHNYLPARIFIASKSNDLSGTEESPYYYCYGDILEYPSNNGLKEWKTLVTNIFKQWVFKFTGAQKFNIVIHFQRGEDFEGFERWKNLRKSISKFGLDEYIKIFLFRSNKNGDDTTIQKLSEEKDISCSEGKWLFFDNHGKARSKLRKDKRIIPDFYQVIGSDININNHTIFDQLQNVSDGFSGVLFLLQLIETSLMKILFIDERITSHVASIKNNSVVPCDPNHQNFVNADIYFALSFRFPDAKKKERCFLLKTGTPNEVKKFVSGNNSKEGIVIKNSSVKKIVLFKKNNEVGWEFGKLDSFDAIVIHWGWIEHLKKHHNLDVPSFLKSLETFSNRVIITSGRGKTGEIPSCLPFIEFSSIQNYSIREISKCHIGKITYSSLAKKDKEVIIQ